MIAVTHGRFGQILPFAGEVRCPARTGRAPCPGHRQSGHGSQDARDVRELLGHLPKETRPKDTFQHGAAELKKAPRPAATRRRCRSLQIVLQLERVEYRAK